MIGALPRMTFARFMEHVLYGPDGYYADNKSVSGRAGDYFTAADTGPLFGQLLFDNFRRWANTLSSPLFHLVEAGGGAGKVAKAITQAAAEKNETDRFPYTLIEESYARRQSLDYLGGSARIISRLSALEPFHGCLFANELIDAMPVHRIRQSSGQLQEAYVVDTPPRLHWDAPSTPRLSQYLDRANIRLADGQITEVNLAMSSWLGDAFAVLKSGFVVLIDYGDPAAIHFDPSKPEGTLRRFSQHRVSEDLLAQPGDSDLTADVDFTGLALDARDIGFEPLAFYDLSSFLALGGVPERQLESAGTRRALTFLIHPDGLGSQFHVLILGKSLPSTVASLFPHNRLARLGINPRETSC